jgi:hypothetical protein
MTSFSQLPDLDLWKATSSQCTLQSAVFIRSLLTAMSHQDFGAIQCGFDKALQLSLGIEQTSKSNNQVRASSPNNNNNNTIVMNQTTMAASANTFLGATSTMTKIPQPPPGSPQNNNNSVPRGGNSSVNNNNTNTLTRRGSNLPGASLNTTTNKHHLAASSSTVGQKTDHVSKVTIPITLPNPASLNHPLSLFSFSSLISKTAVSSNSSASEEVQQHAHSLLESNNKLISSHPTLSLYSDWLFFCFTQSFTVLQTQHCLILLSELLEALAQVDPVEEEDEDEKENSGIDNAVEDLIQAYGSKNNSNNTNSPNSTANSSPSQTTNTGRGRENSQASNAKVIRDYFGGAQPPESVIDALTSFLAKSCSRKEILVVDEEKLKQVQLEKQKAEEAEKFRLAQVAAAQSMNPRDAKNKGKHGKQPPSGSKQQNQQHEASVASIQQQQDESILASQQQQLQSATNQTFLTNRNTIEDPNPHVKQIILDPVFNGQEVQAICSFVNETILQQWRLVSVLQRAPDGLTLPSTQEVIIETIPVALPSLQFEGTAQKIYSDTQARANLLTLASNTLRECYNEAIAERNITILPEFDRSTSVATRRDKTMREDDARKQMRPDEFKRTVKVLARVMGPEKVLEQLATNPVALNKEDEVSLEIAKKTKEQEEEYRQAIREFYQTNSSSPNASPGSSVSNLNIAAVMRGGGTDARKGSQSLQHHQNHQVPQPPAADQQQQQEPVILTLEQRLERLEQAVAAAAAQQQNQSPGSHSRRHR